ncbi:MAG: hypothetical protein J7K23_03875 [Thermoproteales archaeon]|nr:hypothetical protein [Thermoproteales archaeon]
MVIDIFSSYFLFERRINLHRCLKENGFYVRMHAYEYIVGDYKRFKAIIFIEPYYSRVFIKILDEKDQEAIKTIIQCIRVEDPGIEIITI